MAHKVSFTERNGEPKTQSFPTLALASIYARGVKNGKVLEGGTDDAFTVTKCGSKEEEENKRIRARLAQQSEREAEASTEAGIAAILDGEDASSALDSANLAAAQVVNECACGKRIGAGQGACYTCRRYA